MAEDIACARGGSRGQPTSVFTGVLIQGAAAGVADGQGCLVSEVDPSCGEKLEGILVSPVACLGSERPLPNERGYIEAEIKRKAGTDQSTVVVRSQRREFRKASASERRGGASREVRERRPTGRLHQ